MLSENNNLKIMVIAIGNRLMGDDGIAVRVAEAICRSLEELGIKVIVGETDVDYCISKIDEGDYLIILDATCFGNELGTITLYDFKDIQEASSGLQIYSQHGYSLIHMLKNFHKTLDGVVVGIEGCNFDFSVTLSSGLEEKLDSVCREVKEIIYRKLYCRLKN